MTIIEWGVWWVMFGLVLALYTLWQLGSRDARRAWTIAAQSAEWLDDRDRSISRYRREIEALASTWPLLTMQSAYDLFDAGRIWAVVDVERLRVIATYGSREVDYRDGFHLASQSRDWALYRLAEYLHDPTYRGEAQVGVPHE